MPGLAANILEMPNQLERTDFAAGLGDEFLSFLKTLQNADGGWGFHAGEPSRVEPTCWAMRALTGNSSSVIPSAARNLSSSSLAASAHDFQSEELRRGAGYLQSTQLPDGSWPPCTE